MTAITSFSSAITFANLPQANQAFLVGIMCLIAVSGALLIYVHILESRVEDAMAQVAISPETYDRNVTAKIESRYLDAYRVVRFTNLTGKLVKIFGAVVGGFVIVLAALMAGSFTTSTQAIMTAVLPGALIILVAFLVGTHICAEAQHLMAALDAAVYASPFMTNESKLEVMHLQ